MKYIKKFFESFNLKNEIEELSFIIEDEGLSISYGIDSTNSINIGLNIIINSNPICYSVNNEIESSEYLPDFINEYVNRVFEIVDKNGLDIYYNITLWIFGIDFYYIGKGKSGKIFIVDLIKSRFEDRERSLNQIQLP